MYSSDTISPVPVEALTASLEVEGDHVSIAAPSHAKSAIAEDLTAENCIGRLDIQDALQVCA